MKTPPLATITRKYVGVPYRLGGTDAAGGLDCVSFLRAVMADAGRPVPDAFEGVTLQAYPAMWEQDRAAAKRLLIRFVLSLGREISPAMAFAWDLLLVRHPHGDLCPGVHAGGNLFLSAFSDRGVDLTPIRLEHIRTAVRWRGSA